MRNPHRVVLVVDDAYHIRQVIRHLLHGLGVGKVAEAPDGRAALALLRQREVDLLLDWNLPQPSGLEVLRRIRQDGGLKGIPVIMVTGHADRADVTEAIQAGITDCLIKPFNAATLEKKVKKIFSGA